MLLNLFGSGHFISVAGKSVKDVEHALQVPNKVCFGGLKKGDLRLTVHLNFVNLYRSEHPRFFVIS